MIKAIKSGKKCRREGWSGDKFIYYVPAARYNAMTEAAKTFMNNEWKG